MRELPPIYRFFPADQFNHVDRPGIMISASNDENAASVAKNLLHLIGGSGELWADNQMIRLFHSPEPNEVIEPTPNTLGAPSSCRPEGPVFDFKLTITTNDIGGHHGSRNIALAIGRSNSNHHSARSPWSIRRAS